MDYAHMKTIEQAESHDAKAAKRTWQQSTIVILTLLVLFFFWAGNHYGFFTMLTGA